MTLLFFIGLASGILVTLLAYRLKTGGFQKIAQEIVHKAELHAEKLRVTAELALQQKDFEARRELEKVTEQKLSKVSAREEKLDHQIASIEKRLQEIERKEKELARTKVSIEERQQTVEEREREAHARLETLAGLSTEQAKALVLQTCEKELQSACTELRLKKRREAEQEAESHASELIVTAIGRIALPTVSDVAVVTVALPSQEMKGRVIGREGRNIRVLEQATGMNFVIDDTPNAVIISGFDPVRREVAKIALKELIQDGRIHPTRIEEVVAAAEIKVQQQVKSHGEEAALKAGRLSFHPELLRLLGLLHFRYSYGQNVLTHSLEVSHLMGIMADELHLDSERARRIGLLHDIGKAVSQEVDGSHALIGQQMALQYGESAEVANGIGCHHGEILPTNIEASLCSAADTLSAARPGARTEALESYLKRSLKLETLSRQFEGVEKAYAMHAGQELRVIVEPDRFDDLGAHHLARQIAQQIEKEMSYPGKIKVTVIRESKAVEYAS